LKIDSNPTLYFDIFYQKITRTIDPNTNKIVNFVL